MGLLQKKEGQKMIFTHSVHGFWHIHSMKNGNKRYQFQAPFGLQDLVLIFPNIQHDN